MKRPQSAKHWRVWMGGALAIASGWLALTLWVLLLSWSAQVHTLYGGILLILAGALGLILLPFTGFAAGFICAFLWHPVAERVRCEQWGAVVVALFLSPLLVLTVASGLLMMIGVFVVAFPFVLVPFHRAISVGFRWWHDNYWRQFAGLSNEWERDTD